MSLAELKQALVENKTKVEQLIEKAQSGGGESGAIDYPEWDFTRPAWWLPRPKVEEPVEGVNEAWFLIELEAEETEYNGIDVSKLEILPNGKKQLWEHVTATEADWNDFWWGFIPIRPKAIEIITNSLQRLTLKYRYQAEGFTNLQIITGTPIYTGSGNQDGFASYALRVIDCEVLNSNTSNNYFFRYSPITATHNITWKNGSTYRMFRECRNLRTASVENSTNADEMFRYCNSLEKLHLGANVQKTYTSMLEGCTRLKYLTVENDFSSSLYIHHSTQFPAEVLHAIIENYADMTGQTAPTFQVGTTNLAKIDDEHKAMLEAKNINYL